MGSHCSSLLTRNPDSTNQTLKGMGPEYVSDLNKMNTLRELNQKLPTFGEQSGLKHLSTTEQSKNSPMNTKKLSDVKETLFRNFKLRISCIKLHIKPE